MYLELLPFQIKIIESILQRQDIGIVAKASFLKNDPGLESKSLQNYLVNNEYETIGYCLVAPEKLIPVAKSALEWSNDELEYYLIKFQEKNESEMFGQIDLSLPKKLEYFLDLHTDVFLAEYLQNTKQNDWKTFSEFAALYHSERSQPNIEARVDNLIRYLVHKALGKDFLVEIQAPLDLFVNKTKKDAIGDISVCHHSNVKLKGLVVVEDKTMKNVTGTLEAQLIAEGIAVAQQKEWNLKWPVFMVSTIGRELNFYKAIFSETLLRNIREGYDCKYFIR